MPTGGLCSARQFEPGNHPPALAHFRSPSAGLTYGPRPWLTRAQTQSMTAQEKPSASPQATGRRRSRSIGQHQVATLSCRRQARPLSQHGAAQCQDPADLTRALEELGRGRSRMGPPGEDKERQGKRRENEKRTEHGGRPIENEERGSHAGVWRTSPMENRSPLRGMRFSRTRGFSGDSVESRAPCFAWPRPQCKWRSRLKNLAS